MNDFRPRLAVAASVGLLTLAAASAASTSCGGPSIEPCGVIPEGGCPVGRGGTCDDMTCSGLFDCVDGDWSLVETCDRGSGGSGSTSSSVSSSSTGCVPAQIDHTGEVEGCTPDLEPPDCPAAAAELCNPCLTGCVDFFICVSAGWKDVAFCTEEGELVLVE